LSDPNGLPIGDPIATLEALIRLDTRNPGGDETACCAVLQDALATLEPDALDRATTPDGHAYVYAAFGRPQLLVNAHVDTVPAGAGWSHPPGDPRRDGDRLVGLGTADTKGAIAAILSAAARCRPRDVAILFSGDEEHGGSAMNAFVASGKARGLRRAIVCEPTSLRVGTRHRGVLAFSALTEGEGGHSSRADHLGRPLVELARLAIALDEWGAARRALGPPGFEGLCLNIAELRGGVAFNVVPTRAELVWSLRPPPGADIDALCREMAREMAEVLPGLAWHTILLHAPFATRDLEAFRPLLGQRALHPVDLAFWTEAAVLSAAGIDAVVFGPGDIAHAHAPDESIALAELHEATAAFEELFRGTV
jgi:acetylornithine deacetylase